jgi:predicted Zn-dependent peptidase
MAVLGTNETVSAIEKKTLINYIKKFYTPDRIIISAAGRIDHEAVADYFEPLFKELDSRNPDHQTNTPRTNADVSCHYKDLEQVHVCLGGKGPHSLSDLRFAGAILNTILGGNMSSRLFQEIREKRGLAYSVYSFLSTYMDTGLLGVYAGTNPLEVNHLLGVINTEIKKIQNGEISASDLAASQEHLIGGILLGAESTDNRMIRNARNEYVFGRFLSDGELIANLEKVTIDDVVTISRDIFTSDEVSLATLGPLSREDLDLENLHFADN